MSAAAIFATSATAHTYAPLPAPLTDLPTGTFASAARVWSAICDRLRPDSTDLHCTDAQLSQNRWLAGYSLAFLRKGLHTLESLGMIGRTRRHGLRTIHVLARLRGRERPKPTYARHQKPKAPAPQISHPDLTPQAPQAFSPAKPLPPDEFMTMRRLMREEMHLLLPPLNCNDTAVKSSYIQPQASAKTPPRPG